MTLTSQKPTTNILLYPCNLVGYVRLGMVFLAMLFVGVYHQAGWPLSWPLRVGVAGWLFIYLLLLDIVDGYLARKLGHATQFGALFDLTLDLLGHTFVWLLSGLSIAWLFMALEWVTGLYIAAFALRPNSEWKTVLVKQGPWLVQQYWKPMPLNLLNGYSNLAHFLCPISLFLFETHSWLSYLTLPGLLIFEIVTAYMLYTFLRILAA